MHLISVVLLFKKNSYDKASIKLCTKNQISKSSVV
jgi:hypothetical protein